MNNHTYTDTIACFEYQCKWLPGKTRRLGNYLRPFMCRAGRKQHSAHSFIHSPWFTLPADLFTHRQAQL